MRKFRNGIFLLYIALQASACSITVKHELSKSAVEQLKKVEQGGANVVDAMKNIGSDVANNFKGKTSFTAPTRAADYTIAVSLNSDNSDQLVLQETSTRSTFATLDLDSLTLTEDGVDFLMVDDNSTATVIDWWFQDSSQNNSGEFRHVKLQGKTSTNTIEGTLDIYLNEGSK